MPPSGTRVAAAARTARTKRRRARSGIRRGQVATRPDRRSAAMDRWYIYLDVVYHRGRPCQARCPAPAPATACRCRREAGRKSVHLERPCLFEARGLFAFSKSTNAGALAIMESTVYLCDMKKRWREGSEGGFCTFLARQGSEESSPARAPRDRASRAGDRPSEHLTNSPSEVSRRALRFGMCSECCMVAWRTARRFVNVPIDALSGFSTAPKASAAAEQSSRPGQSEVVSHRRGPERLSHRAGRRKSLRIGDPREN